jgi:hypothetical protein
LKGSASFLKKRSKKLLTLGSVLPSAVHAAGNGDGDVLAQVTACHPPPEASIAAKED